MWGTSSPGDKLTGDFGNEPDATSISDRGLFRFLAGNLSPGVSDFCNTIGTSRTSQDVRLESAKWGKADLDQVAVTNRNFMSTRPQSRTWAQQPVCRHDVVIHAGPRARMFTHVRGPFLYCRLGDRPFGAAVKDRPRAASMRDDRRAAEPPSGTSAAMADRLPSTTADRPPCRSSVSARLPAVFAGKIAECIRKRKPATPRREGNTGRTGSCLASARPAKGG